MIIKLYSILEERELKIPSDKLNKINNNIWHYTLTTPSIIFFLGKTTENFIEKAADKRYLLVKKFLKSDTFIKHGPFEEIAGDLPLGFKIGIYATNYNGKTVVISEYAKVSGKRICPFCSSNLELEKQGVTTCSKCGCEIYAYIRRGEPIDIFSPPVFYERVGYTGTSVLHPNQFLEVLFKSKQLSKATSFILDKIPVDKAILLGFMIDVDVKNEHEIYYLLLARKIISSPPFIRIESK